MRIATVVLLIGVLAASAWSAEFMVTNTLDAGPGSLRAAIEAANTASGTNTISFNIPGNGVQTISPLTPLPTLTRPTLVDGYSQPGAAPNTDPVLNNAVLKIELDGRFISPAGEVRALRIGTSNCLVRGLVINRFPGAALSVNVDRHGHNVFSGNFVGTDPSGLIPIANGGGIYLRTPFNRVGGPAPADRNVLMAGAPNNVLISGADAFQNVIAGNFIGVNAAGTNAIGDANGILIAEAHDNQVGGPSPTERNVIGGHRGNPGAGVHVRGVTSVGNQVIGNWIGTDASGRRTLGNNLGVLIQDGASRNVVGGLAAGAGNLISGNATDGISIRDAGTFYNRMERNWIGTDVTGSGALGNGRDGIRLQASYNRVGTAGGTGGNRIGFNLGNGVAVIGPTNQGNSILGNSIVANHALGIDLELDGVTTNDPLDADAGANGRQNFPTVTNAVAGAPGESLIAGSLLSAPFSRFTIECFASAFANPDVIREGDVFLGAVDVTTDETGFAPFRLLPETPLSPGRLVTATATDMDAGGNTSEFSPGVAAVAPLQLWINGAPWSAATGVLANTAVFELRTGYADGHVFFTTDGSLPQAGAAFVRPLVFNETLTLRAAAYSDRFDRVSELGPLSLEFKIPPGIVRSPDSIQIASGDGAFLSGAASGGEPLFFRWLKNAVPVPGANAKTLILAGASPEDTGAYQFVASNAWGAATSTVATVAVLGRAAITVPPQPLQIVLGDPAEFCVQGAGDALTYQWRRNGEFIPGATNPCLTLAVTTLASGGSYSVTVANALSATTSPPALLEIEAVEVPGGDNFADRVTLVTDHGFLSGSNASATFEDPEPFHAGNPASRSVWYLWRPSVSGLATFTTTGSAFDTVLAVYSGADLATLSPVAADDDGGGYFTSQAVFSVTAGVDYPIAIDGPGGDSGRYLLSWDLEAAVATLPRIAAQPQSLAVRPGATGQFTVTVTPEAPDTVYQWFRNGRTNDGATNRTLTLTNVGIPALGQYHVRVGRTSAPGRFIDSAAAGLEFGPLANVVSHDKLNDSLLALGEQAGGGGFRPSTGGPNGGSITIDLGASDNQTFNTEGSRPEPGELHCGVLGDGRTRFYYVTVPTNANLLLDTRGSGTNTLLAVYHTNYSTVRAADNKWLERNKVVCAIDRRHDGAWVYLGDTNTLIGPFGPPQISPHRRPTSPTANTVTYLVAVDTLGATTNASGSLGSAGVIRLNWRSGTPPRLTSVPASRAVPRGTSIALSVTAGNQAAAGVSNTIAPPSYQWSLNETPLPRAVTSELRLPNIQLAQAGRYTITTTNDFGSTSAVVQVPVFESLNRQVAAGEDAILSVQIADDDRPLATVEWLMHGEHVAGGAGLVLKIGSVTLTNAGEYTLQARTASGLAIDSTVKLSVSAQFPLMLGDLGLGEIAFGPVDQPHFSIALEGAVGSSEHGTIWFPMGTYDAGARRLFLPNAPMRPDISFFRASLRPERAPPP